ncbi:MAG: hypothetical protein ACYCY1_01770 [Sulfuriferula sp.]
MNLIDDLPDMRPLDYADRLEGKTMLTSIASVMFHVDRKLGPTEKDVIEDCVREDPCVISAHVSQSAPHLMLVAYNPDCTSMHAIHQNLAERGVDAQLVGL